MVEISRFDKELTEQIFAIAAPGSAGRSTVLQFPNNIGARDYANAREDPFNVKADAFEAPFTSAVGQVVSYSASPTDIGKTICIPGGGFSDGGSSADSFVSIIMSVNIGVNALIADVLHTDVPTPNASSRVQIGTDNSAGLQAFAAGLSIDGTPGNLPLGNIMYTTPWDIGSQVPAQGMTIRGMGAGSVNPSANSSTVLWFCGPRNRPGNGIGNHAVIIASSAGKSGVSFGNLGIRCLGPLSVSTTVVGTPTISTAGTDVTVANAAGFPQVGRATMVGSSQEVFWTSVVGNVLKNVKTRSGSWPISNGAAVQSIHAGLFVDFMAQSNFESVTVAAYRDSAFGFANLNQGIGAWFNNFTSGFCSISLIHTRYFNGTFEGIRYGTCEAGYGVAGNSGNCRMDTCTTINCAAGFHFVGISGPVDGCSFLNLKTVGCPAYGFKIEQGFSGCSLINPHSEGGLIGIWFNGCIGCSAISPYTVYHPAGQTPGDGSCAFWFAGNAKGNWVKGGTWLGWVSPVPGSASGGFDSAVKFDSTSRSNSAEVCTIAPNTLPGVQSVVMGGTGNKFLDMDNPVVTWGCSLFASNQSYADNALQANTWGQELWKNDIPGLASFHSTVTNNSRITIPLSGWYRITGQLAFVANVTGLREVVLRLNATSTIAGTSSGPTPTGEWFGMVTTPPMQFTAGDFIELYGVQHSAGALNSDGSVSFLAIEYLFS